MANIEKLFLEARKSVQNINPITLSHLVTFDELFLLAQDNSLKEFIQLISKKEIIFSLLRKYNLPYHIEKEFDFQKVKFTTH